MSREERMAYDEYVEDKRVQYSVLRSSLENQRIEFEMEIERNLSAREEAERHAQEAERQAQETERKLASTIRMLREAGVPLAAIAQQLGISVEDAERLVEG